MQNSKKYIILSKKCTIGMTSLQINVYLCKRFFWFCAKILQITKERSYL